MAHQTKSTSNDVLFCFGGIISRDSNPERAKSVKKKLPVAVFLAFCCKSGTERTAFGRRTSKTAKPAMSLMAHHVGTSYACSDFFISKKSVTHSTVPPYS
jgi:hypothetical protein